MAKKKLDKEKPFAEIFGSGKRRYEQSGKFFDVHGELVVEETVKGQSAQGSQESPASDQGQEEVSGTSESPADTAQASATGAEGADAAGADKQSGGEPAAVGQEQAEGDPAEETNKLSVAIYAGIPNAETLKAMLSGCDDAALVRELIDIETALEHTRASWMNGLQARLDVLQAGSEEPAPESAQGQGGEQASLLDDQIAAQGEVAGK